MARGQFPSDKADQFMVRFPDGMRDRIKTAADANNRSMNAEIIARLEMTFAITEAETAEKKKKNTASEELKELRDRVEYIEKIIERAEQRSKK